MPKIAVHSRVHSYSLLIGVVVGTLFAGLAVPLAFGTSPQSGATSSLTDPGSSPLLVEPTTGAVASTGPLPGATAAAGGSGLPVGTSGTTGGSAGSGTSGAAAPGPVATRGAGGSGALTSSDVGVTATTIKLGVVLLDLSALTPLGLGLDNYEVSTQRAAFDVYIADANKKGGLFGRRIIADYATLNPLDSNGSASAPAICRKFTEDDKVFAVTGYAGDAATCAAVQYRTPAIFNLGTLKESYTKSHNYLVGGSPTLERIAQDWAGFLVDKLNLSKAKIGVLSSNIQPSVGPAGVAVATLKALGHPVTYWKKLDSSGDASQLAVAVQQFRAAGVDTVMLFTDFVTALQFVQNADNQNWKPQYLTSDFGTLSSNGLVKNMSSGFDGAIAVTGAVSEPPVVQPEPAVDRSCRTEYNSAASGKDFAWGEESPIYPICMMMRILVHGLTGAGPTLTRAGLVDTIQHLGALELPSFGQGTFAPTKTDFGDQIRPLVWHYSCKCYASAGPPSHVKY